MRNIPTNLKCPSCGKDIFYIRHYSNSEYLDLYSIDCRSCKSGIPITNWHTSELDKACEIIKKHIENTGFQDAGKKLLMERFKFITGKIKDDLEYLLEGF